MLSWSYQQLEPAAARLFRLCGLHPGHDVDVYALTALLGADTPRTTRRLLTTLTRAHLIERTGTHQERYQQHDLLWGYAAELAESTDGDDSRAAALTRLFDHYRYTASLAVDSVYPDGADARPRFPEPATPVPDVHTTSRAEHWPEAEHANLLAAAVHAGNHDWPHYAGDLSATLYRHIRRRARHADTHTLHSQALAVARTLGNRDNEQTALAGLAHTYQRTGRYEKAAEHYRQALTVARECENSHGELTALGGLADNLLLTGNYRQSAEYYRQVLAVASETGSRLGGLKAIAGLGHCDLLTDRYEDAAGHYRQSLAMAREIGNRSSELSAIVGLGRISKRIGHYQQAADYYQEALAGARATGHLLAELFALARLGDVYAMTGHYEQAEDRSRTRPPSA
ncbi:tetratricopeptide repeat protein [Actinophytocola sp.]|uniref:tetratricopeptide repeat protein n=1 Tax=Actinophytocola sp. TaxID=1872138 RepID=UPI003D6AA84D